MSDQPLVSFIVTVHNEGTLLLEAIESVLCQTYQNIEIIVVDDGSTDSETLSILAEIESSQPFRVIRQSNSGPSSARNVGISVANGEFFFPLDADDKIEPSYCEKAVAVLSKNSNVGILYARGNLFGAESGPWLLPEYKGQSMVVSNVIPSCCFYRRSDWALVGGYCEALVHGLEDYDFILSILDLGRTVTRLDESLFWYRKRAGGMSAGHGNRADLAFTLATIMRRHPLRYLQNAEELFREVIDLRDELRDMKFRYSFFELLRGKCSILFLVASRLRRMASFARSQISRSQQK